MDKRFVADLIFAFAVAAVASFALYRLVSNTQPVLAPAPTVKLVLAAHDLEPGAIIRDGDIELKDWPGEAPPGAAYHTQDVVGRSAYHRMRHGLRLNGATRGPEQKRARTPAWPAAGPTPLLSRRGRPGRAPVRQCAFHWQLDAEAPHLAIVSP